jgi:hypothetical protein
LSKPNVTHTVAGVAEAAIRQAGHAAQRRRRAVDRERAPLDDDHAGLLWRVEGGKLMIMSAYSAIIETTTGQQR